MAPHMVRMLGFHKPLAQGLMASAVGGILMMFADWCGRMVMFPNQIPAVRSPAYCGTVWATPSLRRRKKRNGRRGTLFGHHRQAGPGANRA